MGGTGSDTPPVAWEHLQPAVPHNEGGLWTCCHTVLIWLLTSPICVSSLFRTRSGRCGGSCPRRSSATGEFSVDPSAVSPCLGGGMCWVSSSSLVQNIPPRAGVISMPPQSRPAPPSHPGAPRPIPEVHPGAPRPTSDTHPGAPRPVPSAQTKPPDLPPGGRIDPRSLPPYGSFAQVVLWVVFSTSRTSAWRSSCRPTTSSVPPAPTDPAHTSSPASAAAGCRSRGLRGAPAGSGLSQTPATFPFLPRFAPRRCPAGTSRSSSGWRQLLFWLFKETQPDSTD